jgi:GNAT superfamily N-acetyltransferase
LSAGEADAMAAIAARVFLDDALTCAVLAIEPASARETRLRSLYEAILRMPTHPPISAWGDRCALGLVGLAPPGRTRPPLRAALPALPRLLRGARLGEIRRALTWMQAVNKTGPAPEDWVLGPVVVDPAEHGQGVGSAMLAAACEVIDETAAPATVSTDHEDNLGLFRHFGFLPSGQSTAVGVRVFHMRRPAFGRVSS